MTNDFYVWCESSGSFRRRAKANSCTHTHTVAFVRQKRTISFQGKNKYAYQDGGMTSVVADATAHRIGKQN